MVDPSKRIAFPIALWLLRALIIVELFFGARTFIRPFLTPLDKQGAFSLLSLLLGVGGILLYAQLLLRKRWAWKVAMVIHFIGLISSLIVSMSKETQELTQNTDKSIYQFLVFQIVFSAAFIILLLINRAHYFNSETP